MKEKENTTKFQMKETERITMTKNLYAEYFYDIVFFVSFSNFFLLFLFSQVCCTDLCMNYFYFIFVRLYERVFLTSTVCCVEKYTIDAYMLATNTYKKLLIPSFVECCVYCMFRFIRLNIFIIFMFGVLEY